MTALPINPTYVDLYDTYANAYTNATEEQLASEVHDGDRHSVAKLAVFQAGVEAERARAAAASSEKSKLSAEEGNVLLAGRHWWNAERFDAAMAKLRGEVRS